MLPAPIPDYESERIASLRRMLLLSTPDEESFDRVTRVAQRMFKVPIALVSLIDSNRQWFKSCVGLPVRETGRDVSFCGHAILNSELFVIENSLVDPRFADNPLVTGEPRVIFYAGRPLRNAEGFLVGTLCIIDHEPRVFDQADRNALSDLGFWVEQIFYGRELSDAQRSVLRELDQARRSSMLDPMLNIWHRDAVTSMLEREVLRAFRNKSPLAVMKIDVDQLDEINQAHGRAAGDALLIELVRRLRTATRAYDSIGRYADDEFLVVLPDTSADEARTVATRVLKAMDFPFVINDTIFEGSICIGSSGACFVDRTPDVPELLEQAEAALSSAKLAGRGQLVESFS